MKKYLLFSLCFIFLNACSDHNENTKSSEGSDSLQTEITNETSNNNTEIEQILNNTKWGKAKVQMSNEPDNELVLNDVVYKIWLTPTKDQVEIVKGTEHYAKLTKEDSIVFIKNLLN
ncbi:hypothetical protein I2483_17855 [Sporosarcina sp. E16_3]|uniref:hypothetical protein n=1 Tax=Sporosarcina sp. E16_3 TaxID=2789293 RepID=UPI001A911953|nr:hypothetical protein [Sporosarcina sp. E16_3]MBO0603534.1 hypothetical protein [Sporosarcina sp. E16_3]